MDSLEISLEKNRLVNISTKIKDTLAVPSTLMI